MYLTPTAPRTKVLCEKLQADMLMLLSPLEPFLSTSTEPQVVQFSPDMLKLLDVIVRGVNEGLEQVIEVLVTACSWIGAVKSGSDPVRVR